MSASVVACPSCHAKLRLQAPPRAGQKVDCPKCGKLIPLAASPIPGEAASPPTGRSPSAAHGWWSYPLAVFAGMVLGVILLLAVQANFSPRSPDGRRETPADPNPRAEVTAPERPSLPGPGEQPIRAPLEEKGKRPAPALNPASPELAREIASFKGHEGTISSLAFSNDGHTLASASREGRTSAKLWDTKTGRMKANTKGYGSGVCCVAFSEDGRTLVSGEREGIWLWDAATGQLKDIIRTPQDSVRALAFSKDGTLASVSWDDKTVKLWDMATRKEKETLRGFAGEVYFVAFSRDGKTLASGDHNWVKLLDPATGQEKMRLQIPWMKNRVLAFSSDGRLVAKATGHAINNALEGEWDIVLWDARTGQERKTRLKGYSVYIRCLSFSEDSRILASGGNDQTIKLWDVETGKELATLKGHSSRVGALAFSRDGRTLASGSGDGVIKMWDLSASRE